LQGRECLVHPCLFQLALAQYGLNAASFQAIHRSRFEHSWIRCGCQRRAWAATSGCKGRCHCGATPAVTQSPTASASHSPAATKAANPTTEPAKEKSEAPKPKAEKAPAAAGTALAQLDTVKVKDRALKTGYSRDQFGKGWKDPDRNGCDARNDILQRDLTGEKLKAGGCVVLSGVLANPFIATTINFVRGNTTSTAVQIDHVVPMSDAWQKGAQQLAPNQREAFGRSAPPLNMKGGAGRISPAPPYLCGVVLRSIERIDRYMNLPPSPTATQVVPRNVGVARTGPQGTLTAPETLPTL
jgi:hypothetical protein